MRGLTAVNKIVLYAWCTLLLAGFSCSKKSNKTSPPPVDTIPAGFALASFSLNNGHTQASSVYYNVERDPVLTFSFTGPVRRTSVDSGFSFTTKEGSPVQFTASFEHNDSTVAIRPALPLLPLSSYMIAVSRALRAPNGGALQASLSISLTTAIDSADKFPRISDSALLDLVQKQTLGYFWDFGHPVSGMARERNTSGDICTTGGTGFGIMAILAGIRRNFIPRTEGLDRIQKIVAFLQDKCTRYHGAFAHWINGATGATVPFSVDDDGADLVETAYLMTGLLCARQFFEAGNVQEETLRNDINQLWNGVEWNWFRQNNQDVLYWHWSPDKGWAMNVKISGWNEALITYVLAASSPKYPIPQTVYDDGWARNGAMENGKKFFNITLPLGPDYGGPLFFAHYSFLGLNPRLLSDQYADYRTQDTAQARINYLHCVNNPNKFNGYSEACWGLTASDDNSGYAVHSPTNDNGVISPTAAVSSLPYLPVESMRALKFFYYTLGDKIWGEYGFKDAFNLTDIWFADSYLAIDQGPQIVMIENYRSGLLWNLLMSCPEIKNGLHELGFSVKE